MAAGRSQTHSCRGSSHCRFWRRNEKEEKDHRRKAEKEEIERRKKDEQDRELKRQQKKFNFLLTQTELCGRVWGFFLRLLVSA